MSARAKLKLGSWLLVASMLPFFVEFRWRGAQPAEPIVYIITLITLGIALWTMRGGKVGWVVGLLRGILQTVVMAIGVTALMGGGHSYNRIEQLSQIWISLATAIGALWFVINTETRTLVWTKQPDASPRPPSRLRSPRIAFAIFASALLFGSAEQWFVYQHISALELFLRPLYLFLPWAGAWLLLGRSRDSIGLGMLGAFLGDWLGELLSAVLTASSLERAIAANLLPIGNLPALLLGLALALLLPRRSRTVAVIGMLVAQPLYRQAGLSVAALFSHGDAGSLLSTQSILLHAAFGAATTLAICKLRETADPPATPPEKQEAPPPEPAAPAPPSSAEPAAAAPSDST